MPSNRRDKIQIGIESAEQEAQADLKQRAINEIKDVLLGKTPPPLTREALWQLVPQRVREIAKNPDNVEARPLDNISNISVLVVEKGYPELLTDQNAWQQWREEIEAAKNLSKKKGTMRAMPSAPPAVNPMHAKLAELIQKGDLSLQDRILMLCKMNLYAENPQALMVVDFDGEAHKGIGQDFYKNTLPVLAKSMGLRFIIGDNRPANLSFFQNTLGRYTLKQLKPEFQRSLFPGRTDDYFTIQFLYPEDIEKYVNPEMK